MYFGFGLQSPQVKELSVGPVPEVNTAVTILEGVIEHGKENTMLNNIGTSTQLCFTPLVTGKG